MEKKISISRIEDLPGVAALFLESIGDIPLLAFSGEMGAGKTTFIQALCKTLGVPEDVNSPTFSLVNEYFTHSGESLFHFDLYRIEVPKSYLTLATRSIFTRENVVLLNGPKRPVT